MPLAAARRNGARYTPGAAINLPIVSTGSTHGIVVAASIRGKLSAMLDSADAAGIYLGGGGYRSSAALVRELVLSIELVEPVAVIRTPPGTANLVARRIDEAGLPGIAGTVAGDDTIIAVLSKRGAGKALKDLLAHVE